jgi:phytoene desaturase
MAPEGYHTGYTLICVPNKAKGKHDWSKAGPEYMEKVLKLIEEKGFIPNLKERLVHSSFISPDYFEKTLNAHIGAAFGVSPLFRQSAFFRPHNRSEDIKNLYLAGSNTIPGAGVPAVMMSAKITSREIAKDFGIEV